MARKRQPVPKGWMSWDRVWGLTKPFVEGLVNDDPTTDMCPEQRECARRQGLAHLARQEQNRLALVSASQWRAGRDCQGNLTGGFQTGGTLEEAQSIPKTWEELVARRRRAN